MDVVIKLPPEPLPSCPHGQPRHPAGISACQCCGGIRRESAPWCFTCSRKVSDTVPPSGPYALSTEDPPEKTADWTFCDKRIAETFDSHVREQLPWYDMATGALAHFVRAYLPDGGVMYDLGASTGNVGRAVAAILRQRRAGLVAVEPSEEMRAAYRGPDGVRSLGPEERQNTPLTQGEAWYSVVPCSAEQVEFCPAPDVVVMFLCLSFVSVAARKKLLLDAFSSLRPGGVLLILDKTDPPGGYFGQTMRRLTLAGKLAGGSSPESILAKELSLTGVQRPVCPTLMATFGDGEVNGPFPLPLEWFRFGEFTGWAFESSQKGDS